MQPRRIRSLVSITSVLITSVWIASILALSASAALAEEAISVTVDATKTQQKLLHAHLVMPVKPGPLTLYYPKWIPGEHGPDGPIANLTGLKFEANGKTIPWQRDLLDVFTFHVEIPHGVSQLDVNFDVIEPDGLSATDKLMVLEWNEVVLYPADVPAEKLTYDAKLVMPDGWKFGTALPVENAAGNQVSFKPISLDLLVDSPVITGEFYRSIDLTPPGEPIHHEIDIAADSADALNMSPENQKEMINLVAESGKLFGTRHYR
ncbi:MAG: M61 family peptidase, partial [Candidatus Sulfotelmatobacter sp.]